MREILNLKSKKIFTEKFNKIKTRDELFHLDKNNDYPTPKIPKSNPFRSYFGKQIFWVKLMF